MRKLRRHLWFAWGANGVIIIETALPDRTLEAAAEAGTGAGRRRAARTASYSAIVILSACL